MAPFNHQAAAQLVPERGTARSLVGNPRQGVDVPVFWAGPVAHRDPLAAKQQPINLAACFVQQPVSRQRQLVGGTRMDPPREG
jgi:hypothetical protein